MNYRIKLAVTCTATDLVGPSGPVECQEILLPYIMLTLCNNLVFGVYLPVSFCYVVTNTGAFEDTVQKLERDLNGEVRDILASVPADGTILQPGDSLSVCEDLELTLCDGVVYTNCVEADATPPGAEPCIDNMCYTLVTGTSSPSPLPTPPPTPPPTPAPTLPDEQCEVNVDVECSTDANTIPDANGITGKWLVILELDIDNISKILSFSGTHLIFRKISDFS